MSLDHNIHELIVRMFSGEASPEDKKKIEAWLRKSQDNRDFFNDLEAIWSGTEENTDESYYVDEAIRKFIERTRSSNEKNKNKSLVKSILRYAAIFVFILAIPFTWLLVRNSVPVTDSTTTVMCEHGDKTSIILPDNSKVWLNSGSQITFSNNFEKGSRSVFLEGEAYFDVMKNPDNPFFVNTPGMNVKVLGTQFNLKAYPDEETVSVTLVAGSLQVSNSEETAMVTPGQKLLYEKANHSLTIDNLTDLASETEWTNGRLVFRNESLEELELKLERWFDVEIEFADETVRTRRFSATLERESILEVISCFGNSQYVDYQVKGNVITFMSENN